MYKRVFSITFKLLIACAIAIPLNVMYFNSSMKLKSKDVINEAISNYDLSDLSITLQTHSTCPEIKEVFHNKSLETLIYDRVQINKTISDYVYDKSSSISHRNAVDELEGQVNEISTQLAEVVFAHSVQHPTVQHE